MLDAIGEHLGLRTTLDQHYSVFDRTGASGFGDTSEFIRKGKIEPQRPGYAEVQIPITSRLKAIASTRSVCLPWIICSLPARCPRRAARTTELIHVNLRLEPPTREDHSEELRGDWERQDSSPGTQSICFRESGPDLPGAIARSAPALAVRNHARFVPDRPVCGSDLPGSPPDR